MKNNFIVFGTRPYAMMNTRTEITQAIQDFNNGKFGQLVAAS
jgi:hypothetical protein